MEMARYTATTMVPVIMVAQPNKITTIPTPWCRLLVQSTDPEAAAERDVRPAQVRSPTRDDAVVIASIEAAVLEEMPLLLVQERQRCPKMKENSEGERRKHADVSHAI